MGTHKYTPKHLQDTNDLSVIKTLTIASGQLHEILVYNIVVKQDARTEISTTAVLV